MRHPLPAVRAGRVAVALLAVALLVLLLPQALAAAAPVTRTTACAGVNLRAGTSTSTRSVARLARGVRVTVVATVTGSAWRVVCPTAKHGSKWYRITAVNGRSVRSLYGVAAVYGATGILGSKATPVTPPPKPTPPAVTPIRASTTFHGRGWGHGVGMSQYGARGRAIAGQTTAAILAHYYRGTTIGTLAAGKTIRVLVLRGFAATAGTPLTLYGRGKTWTIDGITQAFPADARLRLVPTGTGAATTWQLQVDDAAGASLLDVASTPDVWIRAAPGTTFELASRTGTRNVYRGAIHLVATATVDAINVLPLEWYLRGVVPAEMPASWPAAALAAQAIAARSYAARHLRPGVSTFDVYDDTRSQVYGGVRAEKSTTTAAIRATAGKVLRSGTAIANALYHSTGGGATENNENAFVSATGARLASPVSYLRGSADRRADGTPYDGSSPYATWQTRAYTAAELSAIFEKDPRTAVGTLTGLDLRHRGVSGRLISVILIGTSATRTVSGDVFVAAFNAGRPAGDAPLRSTLLNVAPVP